jgi:hypothetical protein
MSAFHIKLDVTDEPEGELFWATAPIPSPSRPGGFPARELPGGRYLYYPCGGIGFDIGRLYPGVTRLRRVSPSSKGEGGLP